jgi:ABC-type dipeptide/oligopeptide/nickel transport system permease subunit
LALGALLVLSVLAHFLVPPSEGGLSVGAWWLLATRQVILGSLTAIVIAAGLGLALGSRVSRNPDRGLGWLTTRGIEAFGPIPTVVLAGALRTSGLVPTPIDVLIVVSVFKTMDIAQWVQSHGATLLEAPYVRRARALGASPGQTFRRHILPELWLPLRWQAATTLSTWIALDAGLELCGFAAQQGGKGWGAALVSSSVPRGAGLAALASVLGSALCLWVVSRRPQDKQPTKPAVSQSPTPA